MKNLLSTPQRLTAFVASRKFFWGVLVFFVLEAVWIALSGRYPMAFDENFHLGIIKLYAHHPWPFWSGQPPGADAYGAVARDPSYLFQYLMSFPYDLISALSGNMVVRVMFLRFINIALFAGGIVIWRRVLQESRASRAVINACIAAFVLVPVVPLLAAQINYDNMVLPVVGIVLLQTIVTVKELRSTGRLNTRRLIVSLVLCLLASLVKYAFLPIFLAIIVYWFAVARLSFGSWRAAWRGLKAGAAIMSRRQRWLLSILVLGAFLLFAQRYVINLVDYHTPVPNCGSVLSVKQCSAYGPWLRNYNLAIAKVSSAHNPIVFGADWFYGMWLRLFFAVDGPDTNFQTRGPLPVPGIASIVAAAIGLLVTIRYGKRIFGNHDRLVLGLLGLVTVTYTAALWLDDFRGYIHTGQPVAINGRYLIPVLLPMLLAAGLGVAELLRNRQALKVGVAALAFICLLWGGGALTYILRSNSQWYWQNNAVKTVNHDVQKVFAPVMPGYYDAAEFLS